MRIVKRLEDGGCTFSNLWKSEKGSRLVLYGGVQGLSCLTGRCGGFAEDLVDKKWFAVIPRPLADSGITQAEWHKRMNDLHCIQSRYARCCCPFRVIMCLFYITPLVLSGILIFFLDMCHLSCCFRWSLCDPFQITLGWWLQSFNEEVLEPHGVYAKFFTFGKMTIGPGDDEPTVGSGCQSLSTLSFALTPVEIDRFKSANALQTGLAEDANFAFWGCCPCHTDRVV